MTQSVFRGGMSTKPDVDKLMQIELAPGSSIGYDDIERLLGIDMHSSRFRTITNVWRNRVFRETGAQIEADGGSFRVLTPGEAVSMGVKRLTRVRRATARTVVRIDAIDTAQLSDADKQRHALVRRHAAAALDATKAACRAVAAPAAVSGTPLRLATTD